MIEIRTGSDSDIYKMLDAFEYLEQRSVAYTPRILSAHRTPKAMVEAAQNLSKESFRVSICAAGGAAHLPGMTASETLIPVIGLPIVASTLNGIDSFLSIVQMPDGIPVGCVGAGQSQAAAELALRIAHMDDLDFRNRLRFERNLAPLKSNDRPLVCSLRSREVSDIELDELHQFAETLGLEISPYSVQKDCDIAIVIQHLDVTRDLASEIALKSDCVVVALYLTDLNMPAEQINSIWLKKSECTAPMALMGLNRSKNAALYAAQIVSVYNDDVLKKLQEFRRQMQTVVELKNSKLKDLGLKQFI